MRCPRDDHELSGQPLKCDDCKGCWISVIDLSKTVKSSPHAWNKVGESKINCPECYAPMQALELDEVHVDRCPQHGVWFDFGEITDMLRRSGRIGPDDIAKPDKRSTASKVGEGAAGVGTAILEVLGGIVDIVT